MEVEDDCFPLDVLIGVDLIDLFFPKSFSSFFAGLFPREYFKSIMRVFEDNCSNAFISILMAFIMASSQKSYPDFRHPPISR